MKGLLLSRHCGKNYHFIRSQRLCLGAGCLHGIDIFHVNHGCHLKQHIIPVILPRVLIRNAVDLHFHKPVGMNQILCFLWNAVQLIGNVKIPWKNHLIVVQLALVVKPLLGILRKLPGDRVPVYHRFRVIGHIGDIFVIPVIRKCPKAV